MRDIIELTMKAVDAEVNDMCAEAEMMTLGELAAKLSGYDEDMKVKFSDGTDIGIYDSYRGYYRFIALGRGAETITVGKLLEITEGAIGHTYSGYKGGEYTMTKHTPIWVAEYCNADGIGIIRANESDEIVKLTLSQIED